MVAFLSCLFRMSTEMGSKLDGLKSQNPSLGTQLSADGCQAGKRGLGDQRHLPTPPHISRLLSLQGALSGGHKIRTQGAHSGQ